MWSCFISLCPGLQTAHNLKELNPNITATKRPNRANRWIIFRPSQELQLYPTRHCFFRWCESVKFSFHCMSSRHCSETRRQQKELCKEHSRGQGVTVWEGLWRSGLAVTQVFWQEHSFLCCMLWLGNELACILPKHKKPLSYLFVELGSCCRLILALVPLLYLTLQTLAWWENKLRFVHHLFSARGFSEVAYIQVPTSFRIYFHVSHWFRWNNFRLLLLTVASSVLDFALSLITLMTFCYCWS